MLFADHTVVLLLSSNHEQSLSTQFNMTHLLSLVKYGIKSARYIDKGICCTPFNYLHFFNGFSHFYPTNTAQ